MRSKTRKYHWRAFSTVELLIAFAIAISAMVATTLLSLRERPYLEDIFLQEGALMRNQDLLADAKALSITSLDNLPPVATSSDVRYTSSRTIAYTDDDDDAEAIVTARTTWTDYLGINQERVDSAQLFAMYAASDAAPCESIPTGDWTGSLKISTYSLTKNDLLGSATPDDSYAISGVAIARHVLAVSIGTTGTTSSPTLFFFMIPAAGSRPVIQGAAFDNASSSIVGFSTVTAHGSTVYAGNGFGSASAATCSKADACAQLSLFLTDVAAPAKKLSALQLATTSPPFAVTAAGTSAPAQSIAYHGGYLYLGLQKTQQGDEFNIIDVHDPAHPVWRSGARIGRSINSITIYHNRAYLSTDDPSRELMIFDIADALHPALLGSWNAPGSTGFGFGRATHVHGTSLQLGRSYVNNAPELYALNIQDPSLPIPTASNDLGTTKNPRSIVSLLARGSMLFTLTDAALRIFSISTSSAFTAFRPDLPIPVHASGIALACSQNTIYLASMSSIASTSYVQSITTP